MATARKRAGGKPLGPSGWRMFDNGGDYIFKCHNIEIGRLLPDDVFEWTIPIDKMRSIANSLSMSLCRVLPIYWMRVGLDKYKVMRFVENFRYFWREVRENGHQVYPGMRMNIVSGLCLNPVNVHAPPKVKNPEARALWLARVKRFRAKLKALHAVNALEAYMPKEGYPHGENGFDLYAELISEEGPSHDFLLAYAQTAPWYVRRTPMEFSDWLRDSIIKRINRNSVEFRKRMGVFDDNTNTA